MSEPSEATDVPLVTVAVDDHSTTATIHQTVIHQEVININLPKPSVAKSAHHAKPPKQVAQPHAGPAPRSIATMGEKEYATTHPYNPYNPPPNDVRPVQETMDVVSGNKVTTVKDDKNGMLVIIKDKTTGTDKISMADMSVILNTSTGKTGFSGSRNEPYEFGYERRAFSAIEGDQKIWNGKPQIYCADTSGWNTQNTTNRHVNIATISEVRNFMDAHPALAAYVKDKKQDVAFYNGHSVNLDEIEHGLNPKSRMETCPPNEERFTKLSTRKGH